MGELVQISDWTLSRQEDEIGVTLREIADRTGKSHNDMLKKWRHERDQGGMPSEGKFSPAEYVDEQGKPRPTVWLNEPAALWFVSSYDGRLRGLLVEVFMAAKNRQLGSIDYDRIGEMIEASVGRAMVPFARKKKEFSDNTKATLWSALIDRCAGWCPCCDEVSVDGGGDFECDHFLSPSDNALEAGWYICRSCHQSCTNDAEFKTNAVIKFHAYQAKVRAMVRTAPVNAGGQMKLL